MALKGNKTGNPPIFGPDKRHTLGDDSERRQHDIRSDRLVLELPNEPTSVGLILLHNPWYGSKSVDSCSPQLK